MDAGALVAVVGLVFSGFTWIRTQSEARAASQLSAEERATDLALELAEIPMRELEAVQTWGSDVQSPVSIHLNNRQTLIIQKLRELLRDHGVGTAAEEFALATALVRTGDNADALDHFQAAIDKSGSFGMKLSATRGKAAAYAGLGRLDDARALFERALEIPGEFPVPAVYAVQSDIQTLSEWGTWEVSAGACDRAADREAAIVGRRAAIEQALATNEQLATFVDASHDALRTALERCG